MSEPQRTEHAGGEEEYGVAQAQPKVAMRVANPYAINKSVIATTCQADTATTSDRTVTSAKEPPAMFPKDVPSERSHARGAATNASATKDSVREFKGNLPQWQRLPSRNVSFGSAEILTVSELRMHFSLYVDRSVRITGVLLYRCALGADGQWIAFVLGDPLAGARPPPQRSSILGKKNPYHQPAATQRPRGRAAFGATASATKTPLLKRKSLVSRRSTPGSGALQNGTNGDNTTLKTPSATTTSRFLARKRPLSTPNPSCSPIESVVTFLMEQPSVLVLVNPTHVQTNDCAVHMIMVMGEVGSHSSSTSLSSTTAPASSMAPLLNHFLSERQASATPKDTDTTATGTAEPPKEVQYLQARILRNVNGTDMRLQHEALKLRRKHMLERCNQSQQEVSLLLGCGPPPYDSSN